ncbi:MAG TPA: hypothetical protein VNZ44_14955, partial [Pyrinomonadaceae bacterium]|nr:hypothetical protein [Pyrinomonadaceae bacterium]
RPQADAERIVRKCLEECESTENKLPENIRSWIWRAKADNAIRLLLSNFHYELSDLLSDLPQVVEYQRDILVGFAGARNDEERAANEPKAGRQHRVGSQFRNREQRFLELIEMHRERLKPRLLMISVAYANFYPVWKEAKKRYRRYRISEHWKEMIARDFASDELPSDLIKRLGDSYEGEASVLALEHSARLCGAKPNQFGKRKLQALLAESKAWKSKCTEPEFQAEAVRLGYLYEERLREEGARSRTNANRAQATSA